ncbi:hypothetical protein [Streptosporangium sp. NPDC000239]|uniref:hypothetical protein n=1 Tax=unclassified Streptosporangium TaxID=2632669 RepID=UPI0033330544
MTTKQTASGRLGAAIIALLAGLLTIFMIAPAANAAAPDPSTIASGLKDGDHFYADPAADIPASAQDAMSSAAEQTSTVYVALLPSGSITSQSQAKTLLTSLRKDVGGKATILVMNGKQPFGVSNVKGIDVDELLRRAATTSSPTDNIVNFVKLADDAATGAGLGSSPSRSSGGSSGGVLIGILVLAVAGGLGIFFYSRKKKRQREAREAAELAAVKQTVDEDVTKFGEEITDLDTDVKLLGNGSDHLQDWQRALDSYERAKVELAAVNRPDELRGVTTALEEGRYALACVKARVNNQPLPERRSPCFFNPQHGPSVRDVRWAPPGGAVRDVPACAADAEAIERGFEPQTRQVMVDGHYRPYYDAGPAYQPYAYGYYGGFGDVMSAMLVGTMMGSMLGGGWGHSGYGAGYEQGLADGGGGSDFGGGGGDFGGGGWGDFGGGDFGGGDFGGGDW